MTSARPPRSMYGSGYSADDSGLLGGAFSGEKWHVVSDTCSSSAKKEKKSLCSEALQPCHASQVHLATCRGHCLLSLAAQSGYPVLRVSVTVATLSSLQAVRAGGSPSKSTCQPSTLRSHTKHVLMHVITVSKTALLTKAVVHGRRPLQGVEVHRVEWPQQGGEDAAPSWHSP